MSVGAEVDLEDELQTHARSLGGYRLTRRIGRGGMGEVWLAEHALLKRPAAVKLTQSRSEASPEELASFEKRFRREAEVTAQLRSPHTVELYDFGVTEDGQFYYVMEFLEGFDLNVLVGKYGPVPPERAINLIRQACLSLGEAHDLGLVHRDIKPENLFACRMGHDLDFVKVLDFGIVKQTNGDGTSNTGTGLVIGTPAYIAPEVSSGRPPTAQADIYSLGCTLFRLVTGRMVFDETGAMAMFVAHSEQEPERPSAVAAQPIPAELDEVILSCLSKDPSARPQSVTDLRAMLDAVPVAEPWSEHRAATWWRARQAETGGSHASADLSTLLWTKH
jgi:serine/threonine-protein kinase